MKKRVLFVDDELSILKAIKRSFFNTDFSVSTANSAKEALEFLQNNEVDIVVSDVKMPEMDGISFLTEVKNLYPNIDRIVLSGFVERSSVLKAIINGVAFDYMTKPWEGETMVEKLNYIFLMRERLSNKKLVSFLNSIDSLPKLPEIYLEFVKAVENDADFKSIARIIEKDVAISTKILQLVNSAFYTRTKIGSIEQALQIIGLTGIKTIFLYSSLHENRNMKPKELEELKHYDNMIFLVNKLFVKIYNVIKKENPPQEYYMLGIVLYIGKIILLSYFTDRYFEIKSKMKEDKNMTFWEAQLHLDFGDCTHVEIGAYFLGIWNFPLIYFQTIFNYMTPYTAPENIREVIFMLNLAKKYAENAQENIIEEILSTDKHNDYIKEYIYEREK